MGELSWNERGRLWLRLGLRLVLTVILIWGTWKVVLPLLGLLAPFVVALILAAALNPLIRWLQKRVNISRKVLSVVFILLCIALVGGLLAGLIYSLIGQVVSFLGNWQSVWGDIQRGITALATAVEDLLRPLPEDLYVRLSGMVDHFIAWLGEVIPQKLSGAASGAGSFALSIPTWAVSFVIFLMAAYFISSDYPSLHLLTTQKIPKEYHGFLSHVKHVAVDAFAGYIRAQLILSAVVFVILVVGYAIMGEPYALLMGFLLAVMDFIPIIGSGTVMVPWAVIDVALGNYGHAIGLMVIWGVIAVFRRVAEPKVVGDQTGLSPIASLVSIYVGMRLGGVVGMILGPVVCLVVLNIARGGFFDSALHDLRLAVDDIGAILGSGKGQDPEE